MDLLFEVTFMSMIAYIDSLWVMFSYVDKHGEIWIVSFPLTEDQVKKKYTTQSHGSFVCS